jgi:hypothetical protein
MYSQVPCFGNDPTSSCCNGIINTDVPFKVNTERPSLINNWNWTNPDFVNNMTSSLFNLSTIKNPYFETNGLNRDAIWGKFFPQTSWSSLSADSFPNLNPRRGWQVVSYNFGKDYLGNPNTNTNDMKDPYFILYNKYTGQLRLLFTIENNGGYQNRVNTYLGFPQTGNNTGGIGGTPSGNILGSGLFSMYKDPVQTLDEISNPNVMSPAPSNGGTQWSVADYVLQYDPCVCNNNSELKFSFGNYSTQNIQLSGRGVGIISPFGRTGANPALFGKDFMLEVTEGFNADGTFMLNNADAIAKTLYVPPMNWLEKLVKNGLNTAFNAALGGAFSLGGNYLSSAMSSEITPWINQAVKDNKDFAWAIGRLNIKGDTTGGVTQYGSKEVAGALAGYLGTATSGFSMQLFDTKEPGPTNYFLNEFEIKMVGTSTGETDANRDKIYLQNPGSLNSKNINPSRLYPLYNEPLGLFAMLRKPKIKRRANYHKNETAETHVDVIGYIPIIGPLFADETYVTYNGNYNKLEYEIGSNIDFALNPSAEIDYEKTQISAAWKIPIVYKKSCGGTCGVKVGLDDNKIIVKYNGTPFCNFLPDSFFNLTKSKTFIKISNPAFNQDTVYYSTPYIPIEHFKNIRFSYDLEQRACSEFTDVPSGIRLSLMIHYVYKPNAYGEVNEHFQTLDYGVDVETTNNFTKPKYRLPSSGTISIGNTIFTKDTTIYADSIVLNGNISSTNRAVVRIISTKPINQIAGTIDPTVSVYQGSLYPSNPIIPIDESVVKSFCSSSDYKAKVYPYSPKLAKNKDTLLGVLNPSISLHPNPTSSKTTLTLSGYENTSVSVMIFDLVGRKVYTQLEKDITARDHQAVLNTETLQAGTYIVKVFNGTEEKIAKLVILKN